MRLEKVKKVTSHKLGELPIQEKGATFKPAGIERKIQPGDMPENIGYTERYTPAELKIKCNAIFKKDFNFESVSSIFDDSLTIVTTEGKEFLMSQAWVKESCELGDGETEIIYNSSTSPRTK